MWVNYQTECLWLWLIMMHTQKVLQRTDSTLNIGWEIPGPPLKLNFADNQYIDGYRKLVYNSRVNKYR